MSHKRSQASPSSFSSSSSSSSSFSPSSQPRSSAPSSFSPSSSSSPQTPLLSRHYNNYPNATASSSSSSSPLIQQHCYDTISRGDRIESSPLSPSSPSSSSSATARLVLPSRAAMETMETMEIKEQNSVAVPAPAPAPKIEGEGEQPRSSKGHDSADELLETLGYTPELQRTRSTKEVAFMSFVLASIPYGLATTLVYPIIGGGPVVIIWGWLLVSLIIICVAASLGEITSVYPTAGGVYYQAFMLSPPSYRCIASWICGWLFVVGNITITLSVNFGTTLFFVACINVFEKEPGVGILAGETYQVFLIFLAITLLCNAVSALANKWLPHLDTAAIFWTFAGVIAIMFTILIMAKHGRHEAKYVFGHFENHSGWPNGWSFCVGLLHAAYATSSTGMIISMCEEVKEPSTQVPWAMVGTIVINTICGLMFLIPLVFVLPDLGLLAALASGQPTPTIIRDAVGSPVIAIILLIPLMVLAILCGIGCTTAASRCTWAFARDGAIPGSKWWIQVHKKLDVPLNAMMLSMVVQVVLGLIYFGSSAAFNAFSGVGVISLTASYATPIAISLFTGRKKVRKGKFFLGPIGLFCNVVSVAWTLLAMPLFCMPTMIPVTASTVNYAPVVFVAATAISGLWYWVWGHKNYTGPPVPDDQE